MWHPGNISRKRPAARQPNNQLITIRSLKFAYSLSLKMNTRPPLAKTVFYGQKDRKPGEGTMGSMVAFDALLLSLSHYRCLRLLRR